MFFKKISFSNIDQPIDVLNKMGKNKGEISVRCLRMYDYLAEVYNKKRLENVDNHWAMLCAAGL